MSIESSLIMWSPNCLGLCGNEDETKASFKLNYDLKNLNEYDENWKFKGFKEPIVETRVR